MQRARASGRRRSNGYLPDLRHRPRTSRSSCATRARRCGPLRNRCPRCSASTFRASVGTSRTSSRRVSWSQRQLFQEVKELPARARQVGAPLRSITYAIISVGYRVSSKQGTLFALATDSSSSSPPKASSSTRAPQGEAIRPIRELRDHAHSVGANTTPSCASACARTSRQQRGLPKFYRMQAKLFWAVTR